MEQMTDLEMDQQGHGYFPSEPCIFLSGANIPQPNIHSVVTASGNTTNVDSQYLPDTYDNALMYGVGQYTGIQHQNNLDMGVEAPANLYYSGMTPSSSAGVLSLPLNHRACGHLPSSSTFAVSGVSSDDFGRSNGFTDDVRGLYKRKTAEGNRGNSHYPNASSSSSVAPLTLRHLDGVAVMDAAPLSMPQFRGNHIPSHMEVGPHGSTWSRLAEPVMVHERNHLIQGNYLGPHFQPAAPPWLNQQLNGNNCDGHTTTWNQPFPMPYVQAPNVGGSSLENGNMSLHRYHDAANNRSGLRFPHPPPVNHQHHNYHHLSVPVQGVRGLNINFHPPVTAASYRVPINPTHGTMLPAQSGLEMGTRHIGPAPSIGLQMYHPHRGGSMPEISLAHRNLFHMNTLQVDDVTIFEMADFYEVGNFVDHHREMRLDIEDMSYEELLALSERIGDVSTGLSEETISSQLKTKAYVASSTDINLEEEAPEDQKSDSCIICQDEYKNREKIGVLQCGHKYHADCLKKWLLVKNVCPICKSEALTP